MLYEMNKNKATNMFKKLFIFLILFSLIYMLHYYVNNSSKLTYDTAWTEIEKCQFNCEYNYSPLPLAKFSSYENKDNTDQSVCNELATLRGKGQKVITFLFYGNLSSKRGYFKGVDNNAELLPKIYPGWTMRIYHSVKEKYDYITLCKLQCKYKDILDICYVGNLPVYGNIGDSNEPRAWRFIALADPLVDIMISRDLDSHISDREAAAVNEWINLYPNISLHIMRDHPYHNTEILAGMWGAKTHLKRQFWKDISEQILLACSKEGKGNDQAYLTKYLWSTVNKTKDILTHDSYTCNNKKYRIGVLLGFPTQRNVKENYNFVGARHEIDKKPIAKVCPELCRRNKTWHYC